MKVLGVVGSPRKDGNCDVLVKEFLDAADADTEYIFLNHKKFSKKQNLSITIISLFPQLN